jgi:hypothetical protein
MKHSELNQIKSFIAYLHTEYPPDGNSTHEALQKVENYVTTLADKTTKVDGRSISWTDERREQISASVSSAWAQKREAKEKANMVWLWNYDNEPPTQMTKKEASDLVKKSEQHITKQLNEHGDALLSVPGQFRVVCITLTNEPQALHHLLQRTEGQLAQRPTAKKTK